MDIFEFNLSRYSFDFTERPTHNPAQNPYRCMHACRPCIYKGFCGGLSQQSLLKGLCHKKSFVRVVFTLVEHHIKK